VARGRRAQQIEGVHEGDASGAAPGWRGARWARPYRARRLAAAREAPRPAILPVRARTRAPARPAHAGALPGAAARLLQIRTRRSTMSKRSRADEMREAAAPRAACSGTRAARILVAAQARVHPRDGGTGTAARSAGGCARA
jgi:hypothetical protein